MRAFLKRNGLTLVYLLLFVATLIVMAITGHHHYNDEQRDHDEPPVALGVYLRSGDFIEGVFENWESEFLQMGT